MNNKLVKLLFSLTILLGPLPDAIAQSNVIGNQSIKASISDNGNFLISLGSEFLTTKDVESRLNSILNLSDDFSFIKGKDQADNNGFIHTSYVQYFNNIKVEHSRIVLHTQKGFVISANGKIMVQPSETPNLVPGLKPEEATAIAQKKLDIDKVTLSYTPELVLYPVKDRAVLAYKVRMDGITSKRKLIMYNIYVDAANGNIIYQVPLIAEVDVPATAATYYSGTRSITTDSYPGGYRLRDNARKIETYNVKGQSFNQGSAPAFTNPNDVTNGSTTWSQMPYLVSATLVKAADSVRFSGLYDPNISLMSGWMLNSSIDKLTSPPSTYQNVKEGYLPELSLQSLPQALTLPVTDGGLNILLDAAQYRGAFRKDSVSISLNPIDFSLHVNPVQQDTNTIRYDINVLTPGTHNWTNAHGDKGNYKISLMSNPAVDVHWGMEVTHDFYKNNFNYYGYNNDSTVIIKNYYDGTLMSQGTQNNAAALPSPYFAMVYGTGDGVQFNPLVALDIVGHEFSHLITASNANLDYQAESGALNEAFSDMMGQAIAGYGKGINAVTWHCGDGIPVPSGVPYLRSFSDPKGPAGFTDTTIARPQPDTYLGQYWASTASPSQQNDNGGVHVNSGVGNKWFYLLAHGGSGTNDNHYSYNITALGMAKAQNIAFTTFVHYLTSSSDYTDAYTKSLQATADIYGATSTEYSTVKEAWKAVGIPRSTGINSVAFTADKLQVYPNPAGSMVHITSSLDQAVDAELYTILGTTVKNMVVKPGANSYDISSFGRDVYFIRYRVGTVTYNQKLVLR